MARKKLAATESAPAAEAAPAQSKSAAIRDYLKQNPDAAPKAVLDGLKAKGIDVSAGLISFVKYGGNKKKTAKKPGRPAKAKASPAPPEAHNGTTSSPARGSKTEAVRAYLKENPKAPAKAVVEGLKAQGIDVSIALIGTVKYAKGKKKGGKMGRPPKVETLASSPTPATSGGGKGISVEDLLGAKALADSLGGLTQARKALEVLESLR